jgi:cation:H+ antiporter
MSFIFLIGGCVVVIFGANWLVEGASSIAKKFSIPDLVIGLTVVAFGTSAPELTVNLFASLSGKTDIAIGNALGSNIFNTFVILGIAAIIYPVTVKSNTVWKEIPLSLLAALVVGICANDIYLDQSTKNALTRTDGLVMLGFFIIFMYYTFIVAKSGIGEEEEETEKIKELSLGISIFYVLLGLVSLIIGGKLLVDGAVAIAQSFGMSEAIIGLTIVAAGTSMPELATSAVAAYKKKSDIAIGNVVGSNIFNIFFILGISATISPLPFRPEANLDVFMTIFSSILMFSFTLIGKGRQITRLEGALFIVIYIAYVSYLLIQI